MVEERERERRESKRANAQRLYEQMAYAHVLQLPPFMENSSQWMGAVSRDERYRRKEFSSCKN